MQVTFKGVLCDVHFDEYANTGNTAIYLTEAATGFPFMRVSVNMEVLESTDEVAIKDYSENTGILAVLVIAKIVEPLHEVDLGYVKATICRVLRRE